MDRTFLGVLLGCLVLWPLVIRGQTDSADRAEVQSNRLTIEHEGRVARFEGNVRASFRDLKIGCEQLEVKYRPDGRVSSLFAKGGVVVEREGARAEAGIARLDVEGDRLYLEGNPRLRRGEHTLTGSRIIIHLRLGRIDVEEARGIFRFRS